MPGNHMFNKFISFLLSAMENEQTHKVCISDRITKLMSHDLDRIVFAY